MREILSISLPNNLKRRISKASKDLGVSKSQIVKDAVNNYLSEIEFDKLRAKFKRNAEKAGYFTDEDIFNDKDIS